MASKVCTGCGRKKPLNRDYWFRDKSIEGGWQRRCKCCVRAQRLGSKPPERMRCKGCGRYWMSRANVSGRYRDTCSTKCRRSYRSKLFKAIFRGYPWAYPVSKKKEKAEVVEQRDDDWDELEHSALFNPF